MGGWWTKRQLLKVGAQIRAAREALRIADEQLPYLDEEAADLAMRAVVSDDPAARPESIDARGHAGAHRRHRDHLVRRIAELERRQDELLDSLGTHA